MRSRVKWERHYSLEAMPLTLALTSNIWSDMGGGEHQEFARNWSQPAALM